MALMVAVLVGILAAGPAGQRTATGAATLDGKVWVATHASAAPGTLRIFLPDGTLVMTSCVETYRLVRWTRLTPTRIAWEEDGARIEAAIDRITATELDVELELAGEVRTETYRATAEPFLCPSSRGGLAADLVANGTIVYMERFALPPTARLRVELRDDSRGDAAARPLAVQTMTARDGPPFKFVLSVPRDRVDARARLSVFAEISDGARQLFVTRSRNAVPAGGATGMDIRLTLVSSASRDPAAGLVTPAPAGYRCGSETFRIAFDAERAIVTLPDRSVVALPRRAGDRDPRAPRTFTDGRLTFVLGPDAASGPRVQFARGRRAPSACEAVK